MKFFAALAMILLLVMFGHYIGLPNPYRGMIAAFVTGLFLARS